MVKRESLKAHEDDRRNSMDLKGDEAWETELLQQKHGDLNEWDLEWVRQREEEKLRREGRKGDGERREMDRKEEWDRKEGQRMLEEGKHVNSPNDTLMEEDSRKDGEETRNETESIKYKDRERNKLVRYCTVFAFSPPLPPIPPSSLYYPFLFASSSLTNFVW